MNRTDHIVRAVWWLLVMSFIAGAALAGMYCSYWGIGEMLVQRYGTGSTAIGIGIGLGAATLLACRHRTDLLYG